MLAKTLGFSRHSYYYKPKLPIKDADLADQIRDIYRDDDDTLGAKKLAKQLTTNSAKHNPAAKPINHKRVARVMTAQGLSARPIKAKYKYPGKTAEPYSNLVRARDKYEIDLHPAGISGSEVVRSDILEGRLADGSKIRIAFSLRESTAQILSLVIDWRMKAELIVATLSRIPDSTTNHIKSILNMMILWHSDQGSQYGSDDVVDELIRNDFIASMSRAGTPTDNGAAERFVGQYKHAVLRRASYQTIGQLLAESERWINYYNERRPHSKLKYLSPNQYAKENNLGNVPYITVSMC
jgi:transposase InsO family protein